MVRHTECYRRVSPILAHQPPEHVAGRANTFEEESVPSTGHFDPARRIEGLPLSRSLVERSNEALLNGKGGDFSQLFQKGRSLRDELADERKSVHRLLPQNCAHVEGTEEDRIGLHVCRASVAQRAFGDKPSAPNVSPAADIHGTKQSVGRRSRGATYGSARPTGPQRLADSAARAAAIARVAASKRCVRSVNSTPVRVSSFARTASLTDGKTMFAYPLSSSAT